MEVGGGLDWKDSIGHPEITQSSEKIVNII